jgi:hypothetical protein
MRILQISDGYGEMPGRGPLENVVFTISSGMAKMGYGVTILERDRTEKVHERECVNGVNIMRLDHSGRVPKNVSCVAADASSENSKAS